ncbi:MAG: hypothetical protein B6I30_06115 [Desulfobacteraceae bacterium 4572_187]|nr:MAG: hypothetical protein B6I30_06115 [Desulfobacteraceae bacterium 4572_187]
MLFINDSFVKSIDPVTSKIFRSKIGGNTMILGKKPPLKSKLDSHNLRLAHNISWLSMKPFNRKPF